VSREQAELVLEAVRRRLRDCKLELHRKRHFLAALFDGRQEFKLDLR
jgi:hypothetical protein